MSSLSRFIRKTCILLALPALLLGAGGCSLYLLENLDVSANGGPAGGPEGIACSGTLVTLAWDPSASEVTAYKLYYRLHDSGPWVLVDEIPAAGALEYTLDHADFGDGEFDFGVVAVDSAAEESQMHTSLDDTAQPDSGWYLIWAE